MHFYKIGYHSCEESEFAELMHEQHLTEADITRMVAEAIAVILPEYKRQWGLPEDPDERPPTFSNLWSGFDGVNGVAKWLIDNKGFQPVTYALTWSVFGWANVEEKDDWRSYREERDSIDEIREHLASTT